VTSLIPLRFRLASQRAQHLVYMAHIWACAPFLVLWLMDMRVRAVLGDRAMLSLQPVILLTLVYLVIRTWLAWRDPKWLNWEYAFPPIDILIVSTFLYLSHRGPMSNISLLYFLPMISAAGSLNVRWAATVGAMAVFGTAFSSFTATESDFPIGDMTPAEILRAEPLNATFRLYFLLVLSSLMAFQAAIAAGLKERLAVAADRNRIALDMHDGVQGHLITLAQQLELMGRVAERNPARAAELAREGRETTRLAADELRFLVQRLKAPTMGDGFGPALRQYAHNFCTRNGLKLEMEVSGEEENLDPDAENALFRIAQEAMNNVVKHANASLVTVTIAYSPAAIQVTVQDDGNGFAPGVAEGVGLEGMQARARGVEGETVIDSAPGKGTRVSARVPVRGKSLSL
jgi:signal transduction histidine kinase